MRVRVRGRVRGMGRGRGRVRVRVKVTVRVGLGVLLDLLPMREYGAAQVVDHLDQLRVILL